VIGGNISRSPGPLVVDVTAIGTARRRRILTRSGARPGDEVYVTGTIGDAIAGLESLRQGGSQTMSTQEQRYLRPDPRVRAGLALAAHRTASACMDLSDGLADAVRQLAAASGVGMAIDAASLPIAEPVRRWHEARGADPAAAALRGGDDYELLFTVRRAHQGRLRGVRRMLGALAITSIGVVTRERRVVLQAASGTRELPEGFEHFR
jgi:thiamine-monophosphate kinase